MSRTLETCQPQDAHEICVEVFAGISAIVTHEIRNVLAIINENSGLLEDLAMMSGDNGNVPGERVKTMVAKVGSQVERANRLMKDLNTFAHSGDTPFGSIDLQENIRIMTALTQKKAAAKKLEIDVRGERGVLLTTKPLLFNALLYTCLVGIYEAVSFGEKIIAEAKETTGARVVQLTFHCNEDVIQNIRSSLKVQVLLKEIQAESISDMRSICIHLPKEMKNLS